MLAWLEGTAVAAVLNWLWAKILSLIKADVAQKKSDAELDQDAKDAAAGEKNAKTKEDMDKADRDVLGGS